MRLTEGCSGLCLLKFEYFQGLRFHNISGQLGPVFNHYHVEKLSFIFVLEISSVVTPCNITEMTIKINGNNQMYADHLCSK